jgi:diadenylate cyclase
MVGQSMSVWVASVEIAVLATLTYSLLALFWNSRAMDLLKGFGALLAICALAAWWDLPVLHRIVGPLVNGAVIGVVVLFQPELRHALSKLGVRRSPYRAVEAFDTFLDELTQVVYLLAERRRGGLIVLENSDVLDTLAQKGVPIQGRFSAELLESIFAPAAPLHDGAIVLRGTTVLSAATILPLSEDTSQLSRSMGTRHRAALGVSQHADCLAIVISEERGTVSVAREGILTPSLRPDRFKAILRSVFQPAKPRRRSWLEWVTQ